MTGSVWANLAGATLGGITGVEFRLDNSNSSAYLVSFDAEPGTVYIGNLTLIGANIAFAECQTGPRVKLGTLSIIELVPTQDVTLTVRQRYEPTHVDLPVRARRAVRRPGVLERVRWCAEQRSLARGRESKRRSVGRLRTGRGRNDFVVVGEGPLQLIESHDHGAGRER